MGAAGGSAANAKAPAPEPEHRISTGNAGLDSMLEGGVIPRRPYLIVGPAGTGKTSLALEFLCEGIRRGERSLIVTLEEPPNEMRINHRGLGSELDRVEVFDAIPDVMRYERVPFKDISAVRSSLPFSRVPYVIRRTPELTGVEVTITGLEQMLRSEIARRGFTRVVIDSLTALQYFCMKGFNEVAGAQTFLRFLSDLQVTTLLTVESPLEDVDTTERILARGEIRLFRWELDGLTVRAVGVEKFRGGSHDIRLHPYRIGPQGLDINVQVTISRDTRQIVEPVPVVRVAAAPAPAAVGSPLDPLADEVQDLVAIGADTTAVRTAIEAAIAAVKSNDAAEAGAAIARASALAMDVAGDYRSVSPPPTSPSPAAAEAMKRVLARADSARGGVAPTTLPPLPVLAQQLEEVRAVLATAPPPPALAPPPAPLPPAVEVPASPPVPAGALASPPPLAPPPPTEPVVEAPPPVVPVPVPPLVVPPVSPTPTPPPPVTAVVAPAPAPEPAVPIPSPAAPVPAVPSAAPPRVPAPSPAPPPVVVAPARSPAPTPKPASAEPPPPPLPPPVRSATPKSPAPAPATPTTPIAPPPSATPPPFPTRAAPPVPQPKSGAPEAARAPPPPRRAAPPEPPRIPSAVTAVRPGAATSASPPPKIGSGATGETRRPAAEVTSRATPPPLPQMGPPIAPPPPPPPPAPLAPPVDAVPVVPVPPSSAGGPVPPPPTPVGGPATVAAPSVPPAEPPSVEAPTATASVKKKAKRATRPTKKVAAPEPPGSVPGEPAPVAAGGPPPGEPPAPAKPRRKAVRKRKAPSVISAMPGTVPPGEAAAADSPAPVETAPPAAAPPPEAPKEGG